MTISQLPPSAVETEVEATPWFSSQELTNSSVSVRSATSLTTCSLDRYRHIRYGTVAQVGSCVRGCGRRTLDAGDC